MAQQNLTITIPSFTITVDAASAHQCDAACGCPAAVAVAQAAIDADREHRGAEPRSLGDRVRGMRHATPPAAWFDMIGRHVDRLVDLLDRERGYTAAAQLQIIELQRRRGTDPLGAMHDAVADTVRVLILAELMPSGHEYGVHQGTQDVHLNVGAHGLVVGMTGSQDSPANHYVVTTTDDGTEQTRERFTLDLDDVRAWVTAWLVDPDARTL